MKPPLENSRTFVTRRNQGPEKPFQSKEYAGLLNQIPAYRMQGCDAALHTGFRPSNGRTGGGPGPPVLILCPVFSARWFARPLFGEGGEQIQLFRGAREVMDRLPPSPTDPSHSVFLPAVCTLSEAQLMCSHETINLHLPTVEMIQIILSSAGLELRERYFGACKKRERENALKLLRVYYGALFVQADFAKLALERIEIATANEKSHVILNDTRVRRWLSKVLKFDHH